MTPLQHSRASFDDLRVGDEVNIDGQENVIRPISDFLRQLFEAWEATPSDPGFLVDIATTSRLLGVPRLGKEVLETIIGDPASKSVLDLTRVCLAVGKLCHALGTSPQEEYEFYKLAIEAQAPRGVQAASPRLKAKAHLFARGPANRMLRFDLVTFHEEEMRRLAPDVDPDDTAGLVRFAQEEES
jgi:hypothetical protein